MSSRKIDKINRFGYDVGQNATGSCRILYLDAVWILSRSQEQVLAGKCVTNAFENDHRFAVFVALSIGNEN